MVWLDAPPYLLAERVGAGAGRPLLELDPAGTLRRLDAVRRPVYGDLADVVVRVGSRTPQAVAEEIVSASRRLLEAASCGTSSR